MLTPDSLMTPTHDASTTYDPILACRRMSSEAAQVAPAGDGGLLPLALCCHVLREAGLPAPGHGC